MKRLTLLLIISLFTINVYCEEYYIDKIFIEYKPKYVVYSKSIDGGDITESEFLLVEDYSIKDGIYDVTLWDEGNDMYRVGETGYHIKMDWVKIFVAQEVVMKIVTYQGRKLGYIIMED